MKISVVIPAYNEEKYLPHCIKSLKNQTFHDFEIVVVDNNSTDKTAEVAVKLGARVVHEAKKGVGAARKKGFAQAKGEIIVSTDADCTFPKNWLEKIDIAFTKHKNIIALYGISALDDDGKVKQLLSHVGTRTFFQINDWLKKKQFTGCNLAVKKTAYDKTSGFDANIRICEDADLCKKLMAIGKVLFIPHLLVYTSARRFKDTSIKTLYGYMKLYYNVWWNPKKDADTMADMTDIR